MKYISFHNSTFALKHILKCKWQGHKVWHTPCCTCFDVGTWKPISMWYEDLNGKFESQAWTKVPADAKLRGYVVNNNTRMMMIALSMDFDLQRHIINQSN